MTLYRHRQPENYSLRFHPDLIRLHMAQIPRLGHQVFVHRLAMRSRLAFKSLDRPFIPVKCRHDRLQWTSMGQQRDHDDRPRFRFVQAIERRPLGLSKRLTADLALVHAPQDAGPRPLGGAATRRRGRGDIPSQSPLWRQKLKLLVAINLEPLAGFLLLQF